ncbi:MAG TPA: response regulator [Kofleriaceae bacterium]|nr:response regulator [Kofleriaceae bacterium]
MRADSDVVDSRRPTVAVVDDDREVRQALSDALTSAGFAVQLAPHALKLVSALEVDRPAVIVLDVVNSWIDGLGLCRALKRNQEYSEIPIVIVSGKSEPESIRAAFQAGAAAYFLKPLDLSRLVARIRELTDGVVAGTEIGAGSGPTRGPGMVRQ